MKKKTKKILKNHEELGKIKADILKSIEDGIFTPEELEKEFGITSDHLLVWDLERLFSKGQAERARQILAKRKPKKATR
jgi:hypothetical protein